MKSVIFINFHSCALVLIGWFSLSPELYLLYSLIMLIRKFVNDCLRKQSSSIPGPPTTFHLKRKQKKKREIDFLLITNLLLLQDASEVHWKIFEYKFFM